MQFFINPVPTLIRNDSLEPDSTDSTAGKLEQTVRIMNAACIPVLVFAGVALNATSCVVMRGPRMTDQTYAPYFVWLAASDSAFLLSLLVVWSTSVGLTDLYARDGWCLTVTYVSATGAFLSPWYNVALAVDRVVSVARVSPSPPRLRGIPGGAAASSGLRSHLVCLGLVLVAVPAFLNASLIYGVVDTGSGHLCVALPGYVAVAQVLAELEMIVGVLVPSALIVCCNAGTVLFLSRRCCRGGRQQRPGAPSSYPGLPEPTTSHAGRETVDLSVVVQQPLVEQLSDSSPTFEERPSNDLDLRATSSVVLVTCVHLVLSLPAQLLQSWVMLSSVSAERTFRVPQGVILAQHLLLVAWYLRFGCNFPLLLIFNPFVCSKFRLMLRKTFRLKRPRL